MEIHIAAIEGPYQGRGSFLKNYMRMHGDVGLQKQRMSRHPHAEEEPKPSRRASIHTRCLACPLDDEIDFEKMLSGPEFQF